jgi:gas vesicle protein
MSDLDIQTKQGSSTRDTNSSQNLKQKLADAGAEVKQRASDAMDASADAARETFNEAADAAKNVAADAADQIQNKAREQQHSGSDFLSRLANDIRDAARAFESDAPIASRGINSAADYVDDAAEKIRNGTFRDLLDGATDFAKRQPAAFLGLSVLAGFAAVRFFKASGNETLSSSNDGEAS